MLDLTGWPKGMRLIVRAERPHPVAQLRFTNADGNRLICFATIPRRSARRPRTPPPPSGPMRGPHPHRPRHRPAQPPLHTSAQNQIWLDQVQLAPDLIAWMPMLALTGETHRWEIKKLRLRLFSTAARLVRSGRNRVLRFGNRWPWNHVRLATHDRLELLPSPG